MGIIWEAGKVEYQGLVLRTGEMNYHDDSDFYALVWNVKTEAPEKVIYNTTRFGGGGHCEVDATPEVREAYNVWNDHEIAMRAAQRAWDEMRTIDKGDTVLVVKGRKIAKGTGGIVFWVGQNRWGTSVGIETADGTRAFTALENVKIKEWGNDSFVDPIYRQ